MQVGYLMDILNLTLFYSACYQRLFPRKKKNAEIELSSGDENDVLDVKPKLEQTDPCTSVEIELSSGDEDEMLDVKPKLEETEPCSSSSLRS
jgi:hypothetical protein